MLKLNPLCPSSFSLNGCIPAAIVVAIGVDLVTNSLSYKQVYSASIDCNSTKMHFNYCCLQSTVHSVIAASTTYPAGVFSLD